MNARPKPESWALGGAYEPFIGRWSRRVADEFVRWLPREDGRRWLELGCGTGALTQAVLGLASPALVLATDRSPAYAAYARGRTPAAAARFLVADAMRLPVRSAVADVVVSGLLLNFLPDPTAGVAEMARLARPGGTVAGYVWDYAGRMELLRLFWDAAVALDPAAASLDEGARFPICTPHQLERLWTRAGLVDVRGSGIEVGTPFQDFEDYWRPFLGGQGPAPAYVASLDPAGRDALRESLRAGLSARPGGAAALRARAWVVRGRRAP